MPSAKASSDATPPASCAPPPRVTARRPAHRRRPADPRDLQDHPLDSRWLAALLTRARQGGSGVAVGPGRPRCPDTGPRLASAGTRLPARCHPRPQLRSGKTTRGLLPRARSRRPRRVRDTPLRGTVRDQAQEPAPEASHPAATVLVTPSGDTARRHARTPPRSGWVVDPRWRADPRPRRPRASHALLGAPACPAAPCHAARHTTATVLMDLGVDVTVIQSILATPSP